MILNIQNPEGNNDSPLDFEYHHWYINLNVNIICPADPIKRSPKGIFPNSLSTLCSLLYKTKPKAIIGVKIIVIRANICMLFQWFLLFRFQI